MNVRNYIHLTGNLGADPKTYVLPSGDVSCKFSLATNEYYRNREGDRVTKTEWHTVRAYGKLAELFAEHLAKGSQVSIVGSMRYRKWEDKFEQARTTAEVIAQEFTFLSPKPGATSTPSAEGMDAEIEEMISAPATATQAPRSQKKTATRRTKATTTAASPETTAA